MEILVGWAFGIAIFALVEAIVASYMASKSKERAEELYQMVIETLHVHYASKLDVDLRAMKTDGEIRELGKRIESLEFIRDGKKEDK